MSDIIVKTTGLCADFKIKDRMVRAVNRVSLSLERGKTLVILGESGSGKSTYMKALLRILPKTAAVEGQAEFLGNDLFRMSEKEFRDIRGNRMAMIYQDSLSALDPMYKVGYHHQDQCGDSQRQSKGAENGPGRVMGEGAHQAGALAHDRHGGQAADVLQRQGYPRGLCEL